MSIQAANNMREILSRDIGVHITEASPPVITLESLQRARVVLQESQENDMAMRQEISTALDVAFRGLFNRALRPRTESGNMPATPEQSGSNPTKRRSVMTATARQRRQLSEQVLADNAPVMSDPETQGDAPAEEQKPIAVFKFKAQFVDELKRVCDSPVMEAILLRKKRSIQVMTVNELKLLHITLLECPFKDTHIKAAKFLCGKVVRALAPHIEQDPSEMAMPVKAGG